MTTNEFESIVTDLRTLLHFPKVSKDSGLTADGNVLVPVERVAALVEGIDELRAVERAAAALLPLIEEGQNEVAVRRAAAALRVALPGWADTREKP